MTHDSAAGDVLQIINPLGIGMAQRATALRRCGWLAARSLAQPDCVLPSNGEARDIFAHLDETQIN